MRPKSNWAEAIVVEAEKNNIAKILRLFIEYLRMFMVPISCVLSVELSRVASSTGAPTQLLGKCYRKSQNFF